MRTSLKTFAGIAAAGSLMFSLAACSPSNTASPARPARPRPLPLWRCPSRWPRSRL
ncbi:hypothetical protein AHiyo4_46130 [Arthrobacter sp. Hiyo4]|nr:hypothetical protein AHiyo4_46130 [Arthrobacter sp. Hiyo4]